MYQGRVQIDLASLPRRMAMRAIVVDMNCVRQEAIMVPLLEEAVRDGVPLLLPEALLYEGTKGRNWEDGLRTTLRQVAAFRPGFVGLARRLEHLLEHERKTGTTIADLAYREQQPRLEAVLRDVRLGTRTAFDEIRRENPEAPDLLPTVDDQKDVEEFVAYAERFRKRLPLHLLKHLRRYPGDDLPALLLGEPNRNGELVELFELSGYSTEIADALTLVPCAHTSVFLGRVALAIWWISHGDPSTAPRDTLANDLFDLEYLVVGLGCTRFQTLDTRLATIYRQLSIVMKVRWRHAERQLQAMFPAHPHLHMFRTNAHPVD